MSSLPKNFGAAFDLSVLKNAGVTHEVSGVGINQVNLVQDVLPASHAQVVILICWSARSPQSQAVMTALGQMHQEDSAKPEGAGWLLGNVNIDAEPEVAQALQVQTVPLALAIIQEQVVPLFESVPTVPQLRLVIDKVLSLAAERGVGVTTPTEPGTEPVEQLEPEEIEALAALESGGLCNRSQRISRLVKQGSRKCLGAIRPSSSRTPDADRWSRYDGHDCCRRCHPR